MTFIKFTTYVQNRSLICIIDLQATLSALDLLQNLTAEDCRNAASFFLGCTVHASHDAAAALSCVCCLRTASWACALALRH
jgi:hypothetical protein